MVNRIRQRLKEWQAAGRPGVTRTTLELLDYWMREGRQQRLFFAQGCQAEPWAVPCIRDVAKNTNG